MATPHTRKLARELKVDITTVKGSGPQGRVTDDDVRRASEEAARPKEAPAAAPAKVPSTAGFDFEKYGPTRRVPLKGVRKRVAEVMARSASTIPHVTHFDEADVTKLLEVVEREHALAEGRGIKLTILSFLAKAAAASLKEFPILNSSLDEETGEIVYKEYIHIGIATDTEAGLMVPVDTRCGSQINPSDCSGTSGIGQKSSRTHHRFGRSARRILFDNQRRRYRRNWSHSDHTTSTSGDFAFRTS